MDEDGNEIDWSAQMLIGVYKRNVTPVLTEGKSYYIQAETKSGKTEKQQMVALLPNTTLSTTQADIWEKPYENTFTSQIADAGMPASNVVKVNFEKAGTYVLTDSADEESLDATELELYTLGIDKIAGKSQRVGLAKETQFEIPEAGTYYLAINVDADEADYSIQGREGTLTPQPEPTPEPAPERKLEPEVKPEPVPKEPDIDEIPTISHLSVSDDDTDTEESAESIEGEVEAKKNNGPALIGEGEDDDAETDDDGFEFI